MGGLRFMTAGESHGAALTRSTMHSHVDSADTDAATA